MQLQSIHLELDEQRLIIKEQEDIDAAEEFFHTNKAILKAAYGRFKQGIKNRLKLSNIHDVIRKIYLHHLRKM